MSFWEGSALQYAQEERNRRRELRRDVLQRENPSLSHSDITELLDMEERAVQPRIRCCICTTGRAEIIRTSQGLVRCLCQCHRVINGS